MKAFSDFLIRISNWKSLLFFLVIYLFFAAYVLTNAEIHINELAQKEIGVIDLTMGFNPQQTLNMVADYGDEARRYYAKTEMTADVVYPLVYAFLFGIILTLLLKETTYIGFNILPFATMLLDYIENINIVTLLYSFPNTSYNIAVLCEVFKLSKWLSLGLIILLIIGGGVTKLLKKK